MKILFAAAIVLGTLLVWSVVDQYLFCPRFVFPAGKPFQGKNIYNPYETIDSSQWIQCNFHAHSNAWKGVTNGNGTPTEISQTYDSLGYGVHLVSDYHKVDKTNEYESDFIPAYEHGYNLKKVHYLVLGNEKVNWLDYPLPQILSNKQWILKQLSQSEESLIMLNHPDVRNGFENEDLKYLSGYQYMEVLSPYSTSTRKWDTALSSGRPIFVAGNDDVHDIFNKRSVGIFCTWVNIPTLSKVGLLAALRSGSSYGMQIPEVANESFHEKTKRLKTKLPKLNSLQLKDGNIQVSVNKSAREIIFSGNQGKELARISETSVANYVMKETDPYVRTTIAFHDGTKIFLNPVFRYAALPFDNNQPKIDHVKSNFLSFIGVLFLLLWGLLVFLLISGKRSKIGIPGLPVWGIRSLQG